MASADLCFNSIAELAPKLRVGEVSPVDLVDALLARIDEHNDFLKAYLHVDADGARKAARAAEVEIAAGGCRGPLHGIPVAYKDIFHVQGLPTTAGSRLMADYVASEDCTAAMRLRQAGAICMGKLNTIEFASGSMEIFGTARNPWHTERHPGGSSSGSGITAHGATHQLGCQRDTGARTRPTRMTFGVPWITCGSKDLHAA